MYVSMRVAGLAALIGMAAPAAQAAAAGPALVVQVPELTSAAAEALVDACMAIAAKTNSAMAAAVVNPAGNLLHFHAAQGASPTAPITAQLKAVTAARWRRATEQLAAQSIAGRNRGAEFLGDYPVGGGVPIIQGGRTLGAIGVAGPTDPEACAEGAVKAVFGNTVETGRAQ